MASIRDRATATFPSVMLTVLSMIQALALELLWTRAMESEFLWLGGWDALVGWAQIVVVLAVLLLVWLLYISQVIRLVWVPSIYDSVFPFGIGIAEFSLIECVEPGLLGPWFYSAALLLATATWGGQRIFRRARMHPSNREFFRDVEPATPRDFLPALALCSAFVLLGFLLQATHEPRLLAVGSMVLSLGVVAYQGERIRRLWEISMADEPKEDEDPAE